jgi:sterol desaturase/sphingolipid hydroxylase (fatty acid hydroxylase superfamily)
MEHEAGIRLGVFLSVFAVMAIWELLKPRRPLTHSKRTRWMSNIGLVVINTLVVRLLFPTATLGVAFALQQKGWGLFNLVDLPYWLTVIVSVALLDMVIYFQHRLVHAVPLFWRFHRVHHADPDLDITSGARFHTVEIVFSMLVKFAAMTLIGVPPLAALIFEVLLNATAMFNHSNVYIPPKIDHWIRKLIVTPDMHRIHHSWIQTETDSNFGFNLSIWDRLFGTYIPQPERGQKGMQIGLASITRPDQTINLWGMLKLPFLK